MVSRVEQPQPTEGQERGSCHPRLLPAGRPLSPPVLGCGTSVSYPGKAQNCDSPSLSTTLWLCSSLSYSSNAECNVVVIVTLEHKLNVRQREITQLRNGTSFRAKLKIPCSSAEECPNVPCSQSSPYLRSQTACSALALVLQEDLSPRLPK